MKIAGNCYFLRFLSKILLQLKITLLSLAAQSCPPGMIGHYPYCVTPSVTTKKTRTPTPTPRQPPQCPSPSIGKFPNCKIPKPSGKYLIPSELKPNSIQDPDTPRPCIIGNSLFSTNVIFTYPLRFRFKIMLSSLMRNKEKGVVVQWKVQWDLFQNMLH